MTFIRKIRSAFLVIKYVRNWRKVIISILREEPTEVLFRDGWGVLNINDPINLIRLKDKKYSFQTIDRETLMVSKGGVYIICRTSRGYDFGHLLEIFESKDYYYDPSHKVVLDVGVSNADSSIYFAINGAELVIGIEPMMESFELALRNISKNNLETKVKLINAALSSRSGASTLMVSSKSPNGNSLSPTSFVMESGITFDSREEVNTISIEDIVSKFNLSQIDLLKMDCEGCEYEVLKYLPNNILKIINHIVIEYHDGLQFIPEMLFSKGYTYKHGKYKGQGMIDAWKR